MSSYVNSSAFNRYVCPLIKDKTILEKINYINSATKIKIIDKLLI